MEIIQDSDYVLYKTLAEFIKKNTVSQLMKINADCSAKLLVYEKTKAMYLACEESEQFGKLAKKLSDLREDLISSFAVQDRIEKIVSRNDKRLEFINSHLQMVGIYNDTIDKKTFQQALKNEKDDVSEESLNLNCDDGITYKLFCGEILAFKNDRLDLSLAFNQNVLASANSSFYHELISTFPGSVGTIPDEFFMVSNIKNNVLRECILYVAAKFKNQSIKQSNAELGGLLANAGNLSDIEEYAKELKNYLNVCVKQTMKSNMPEQEAQINADLKCVEWSDFLPASKRIAPLAGGIAGDNPKTEEETSEEVRKEQEKEAQKAMSSEELLDLLLADDDDLQEEVEDDKEDMQKAEEERKLNEEREKKQQEEELEEELNRALKKDDHTGDD